MQPMEIICNVFRTFGLISAHTVEIVNTPVKQKKSPVSPNKESHMRDKMCICSGLHFQHYQIQHKHLLLKNM